MSRGTGDQSDSYHPVLTAAAVRSLQAVPPRVAEPLVAFIFGGLAANPRRRGKPLGGELAGHWSARRGEFRIVYRLDEQSRALYVLKIGHRVRVYRPR